MYLSRIKLNTARTRTIQALAAPNIFHGAIESTENNDKTRKLWRLDDMRGDKYLLILSKKALDLSNVAEQFGYDNSYESKSYDNLLERITEDSEWQFRLKANPTFQRFDQKKGRGKVFAHITPELQKKWLKKEADKNGFLISDDKYMVTASQWYTFKKNRNSNIKVHLLSVTYEGVLTVTNKDSFRKALVNGIGREKAYGLGLMTIAGIKK